MKQHHAITIVSLGICFLFLFVSGCVQNTDHTPPTLPTRESKIPTDAIKMTPDSDVYPPLLYSSDYEQPVPVSGPVNTAGAEDSPFIPDDSNELYFFFTPDVRVPVQEQILDNVTGIYVSYRQNSTWSSPERVVLQEPGKLSLDGCLCMKENVLWFCSVREGYDGVHWFNATYKNNEWTEWKNADFAVEYEVGELHFIGDDMYFHSSRNGSVGQLDIWVSHYRDGAWQKPENVGIVNTLDNEGYPYVTPDGSELWFTRTYLGTPAIYRSRSVDGVWQTPELIVSQFAGEPTLDSEGNLYFVHHFYTNGTMIEADIYVAYRK